MPTLNELRQKQSLPLEYKVALTEKRILEYVSEYGTNGVYISFSGGKDSTVLLHIARSILPDIEAVFVDTGLEYPEIRKFVHTFDNVTIIRPKMRFDQVISKYGYPLISKQVSDALHYAKSNISSGKTTRRLLSLTGNNIRKSGKQSIYNYERYKPLIDVDFRISAKCCDVMKKSPGKSFQQSNDTHIITAQMASESTMRTTTWLQFGCNSFNAKHPFSNPMSFWTEQDVLHYIYKYHIPIASVYGEIISEFELSNLKRLKLFDDNSNINSIYEYCSLCTTGCRRTGCFACLYGMHLEKGETRLQKMKTTHPKLYHYCIEGGEYDSDGMWKPNKNGLGYRHVCDEVNKIYGEDFLRYK